MLSCNIRKTFRNIFYVLVAVGVILEYFSEIGIKCELRI